MDDPQREFKEWLAAKLEHGVAKKVTKATGISGDKLTRSKELEATDPKKRRQVPLHEIRLLARHFNELPPGFEEMTSWLDGSRRLVGSFDPDNDGEAEFDPSWSDQAAGIVDDDVLFRGTIPGSRPEFSSKPGMGEGQIDDASAARLVTNGIASGHPVINEWLIPHTYIRHALDARPQGVIILQVVGHSMEPRLSANDRVLVDTSQNTWIGDAVYVIDDGDTVFQVKTLRKIPSSQPPRFEIVSESTPDKVFERGADEFRIVGRVVGRISKM